MAATTAAVCSSAFVSCGKGRVAEDSGLLVPRDNELPSGLFVARGKDPRALVRAAVKKMGGLGLLVKKGDTVLVKPNIGWNRTPEQAADTNPDVVAAVVELVRQAGADKIIVLDHTCADPRASYQNSGIGPAAKEAGARVIYVRGAKDRRFVDIAFPQGKITKSWPLHAMITQADVLINIPVVKHHAEAVATMGLKNMMGLAGGNRGIWHTDLANRICDMNQRVRVDLTVLDGYRVLLRNGPTGGSLADVAERHTLAVSTDQVAADAFGATLLDMKAEDVPAIVEAASRAMGQMDLAEVDVTEISV